MVNLTADWKLLRDLGNKLVFPSIIARLRPDIEYCSLLPLRLSSNSFKVVIILELT